MSLGIYPGAWAEGYITPLYNTNDISDPSNSTGLTITSSIGKLFNRVLNARLDKFLFKYNVIDKCQIGFRKKTRTSDHMFVLKTIIVEYCVAGNTKLYSCFVDFQKAYDTVIHSGIKLKLLDISDGSLFVTLLKHVFSE